MGHIEEQLFGAVEKVAREVVNKSASDKTVKAEIVVLRNADSGEYKVKYEGDTWSAYSIDPNIVYKVGDEVYVLVPNGNYSTKKVIIGYADYMSNISDTDLTDMTNKYIPVGPNWLSPNWYGEIEKDLQICAVSEEDRNTLKDDPNDKLERAYYEYYGFLRDENSQTLPEDVGKTWETPTTKDWTSVEETLKTYSGSAEYLIIEADFQTNFMSTHGVGHYGLAVDVLTENPLFIDVHAELRNLERSYERGLISQDVYEDRKAELQERIDAISKANEEATEYGVSTFTLSFEEFIGQPYSYPVSTTNIARKPIGNNEVVGLLAIRLFQDGDMEADRQLTYDDNGYPQYLPENKILDKNNIFCRNIKIYFAKKVNLLDGLYYGYIETPEGDQVGENISSVKLVPHLYYGYQDILSEETCVVHWYREDPRVTFDEFIKLAKQYQKYDESSDDPFELKRDGNGKSLYDYGGTGWIPIVYWNDIWDKNEFKDHKTYSFNGFELIVPREQVPNQWRYKVVIVYNGKVPSNSTNDNDRGEVPYEIDPVIIYNTNSPFNFELQSFTDSETMKTYLRVYDKDKPQDQYDPATIEKDSPTRHPQFYPEEYARWYLSLPLPAYSEKTTDGETTIDDTNRTNYQLSELVKWDALNFQLLKGPKHITNYLVNSLCRFLAAVYISKEEWPTSPTFVWPKTEPVAALEKLIITETDLDILVEWIGQDTFIYNSNGALRKEDQNINHTLNFIINWLNDNSANFSWEVLGPDGIVLTDSPRSYDKSLMYDFYIDNSNNINFKIQNKYDKYKNENTFTLRIRLFNDKTWEIEKLIHFNTNNGQGANGGEWQAPIMPCKYDPETDYTSRFVEAVTTDSWPLYLNPADGEEPAEDWSNLTTVANSKKLILRPFITKNGRPLSDLVETASDGTDIKWYSYEVFWDVRYPSSTLFNDKEIHRGALAEDSFLSLCPIGVKESEIYFYELPFPLSTLKKLGVSYSFKTDHERAGLLAVTRSHKDDNQSSNLDYTYGAIQIIFDETAIKRFIERDSNINPVQVANYNFYVKATINIYEHTKDPTTNKVQKSKVSTLPAYYPIDILVSDEFIQEENKMVNYSKINCNWPRNIMYNVSGYNPSSWSDPLIFKYAYDNENVLSKLDTSKPENLTPKIQEIRADEETRYNIETGEIIHTGIYEYRLQPRSYFFWADGYNGAISTQIDNLDLDESGNIQYELDENGNIITEDKLDENGEPIKEFERDKDGNIVYEQKKGWVQDVDNNGQPLIGEDGEPRYTEILITDAKGNPVYDKDKPVYKKDELNNYIYVQVPKEKRAQYGTFYRTLLFNLDIYGGNMAINGWDGTHIDINDENGTIFAPTIGAGYKDPFTNTFTGIIMGIDTSQTKEGMDSANYAKQPKEETDKTKYMTGLYGYQDGIISFGIMENGTAFFGRADRGGRIVIDGYNAQIYGGFAGEDIEGSRDMDMTNRMRLSFIDFEEIAQDIVLGNGDNTVNNTDKNEKTDNLGIHGGSISVDGFTINTGAFDVTDFYPYFAVNDAGNESNTAKWSGFGSGRGYSTPAIEIGSYKGYMEKNGQPIQGRYGYQLIRNLKISDFRTSGYYDNIKRLEIPGYRKFLVTYDGTLYAMNAFIKGNLVSSNIIGSQFFNGDGTFAVTEGGNLGIGKDSNELYEWIVDTEGTQQDPQNLNKKWSGKIPRLKANYLENYFSGDAKTDFRNGGYNFFVSNKGVVTCKEIHIAGGSLDIGDFHIIGSDSNDRAGDVVSYGTLYLVGERPTLTTNPSDGQTTSDDLPTTISDGSAIALEGWGNFHLRGRMVNLGQVLLGGASDKAAPIKDKYTSTEAFQKDEKTGLIPANTYNSPLSITTSPIAEREGYKKVQGAFWPLYFQIEAAPELTPVGWEQQGWVCLSSSDADVVPTNAYTLNFGTRDITEILPDNVTSDNVILDGITNWRVDSNGMWSDAILLRRNTTRKDEQENESYYKKVACTEKMTKAEGLIGFIRGMMIQNNDDGTQTLKSTQAMGIKNMSVDAPAIIFEAPGNIRINTGSVPYLSGESDLYLNADYMGTQGSSIILRGRSKTFEVQSRDFSVITGEDKTKNSWTVDIPAKNQFGIYARFG